MKWCAVVRRAGKEIMEEGLDERRDLGGMGLKLAREGLQSVSPAEARTKQNLVLYPLKRRLEQRVWRDPTGDWAGGIAGRAVRMASV
ncbi:MAG: hypothetical protein Q9211_001894 [Gyalolechia sp. 1 TL-2023]